MPASRQCSPLLDLRLQQQRATPRRVGRAPWPSDLARSGARGPARTSSTATGWPTVPTAVVFVRRSDRSRRVRRSRVPGVNIRVVDEDGTRCRPARPASCTSARRRRSTATSTVRRTRVLSSTRVGPHRDLARSPPTATWRSSAGGASASRRRLPHVPAEVEAVVPRFTRPFASQPQIRCPTMRSARIASISSRSRRPASNADRMVPRAGSQPTVTPHRHRAQAPSDRQDAARAPALTQGPRPPRPRAPKQLVAMTAVVKTLVSLQVDARRTVHANRSSRIAIVLNRPQWQTDGRDDQSHPGSRMPSRPGSA